MENKNKKESNRTLLENPKHAKAYKALKEIFGKKVEQEKKEPDEKKK